MQCGKSLGLLLHLPWWCQCIEQSETTVKFKVLFLLYSVLLCIVYVRLKPLPFKFLTFEAMETDSVFSLNWCWLFLGFTTSALRPVVKKLLCPDFLPIHCSLPSFPHVSSSSNTGLEYVLDFTGAWIQILEHYSHATFEKLFNYSRFDSLLIK